MFCRYCGKELKEGEVCSCRTAKPIQPTWQSPQINPGQSPQTNPGSPQMNPGQEPSPHKSHKGLIIGLIIGGAVLIAAAASVAMVLWYNGNHKTPKNQVGAVTETESDDRDIKETEDSKERETVPETKDSEAAKLKEDYDAGIIDYAQVKQALNSMDANEISEEDTDVVIALQEKAESDLKKEMEALVADGKYMEAFKTLTQIQEKVPEDKLISDLKEKYEVDFILQLDSESKKLLKDKKAEEAVKLLEEAKTYVSDKDLMDELIESIKNAPEESDYIIPDSNSRYLTMEDVEGLSLREINYAKNEIYARHGRRFASKELQNYFDSKPWYKGTVSADAFDGSVFNDYERVNADFLSEVEFSIDSKGYQLDAG